MEVDRNIMFVIVTFEISGHEQFSTRRPVMSLFHLCRFTFELDQLQLTYVLVITTWEMRRDMHTS